MTDKLTDLHLKDLTSALKKAVKNLSLKYQALRNGEKPLSD